MQEIKLNTSKEIKTLFQLLAFCCCCCQPAVVGTTGRNHFRQLLMLLLLPRPPPYLCNQWDKGGDRMQEIRRMLLAMVYQVI